MSLLENRFENWCDLAHDSIGLCLPLTVLAHSSQSFQSSHTLFVDIPVIACCIAIYMANIKISTWKYAMLACKFMTFDGEFMSIAFECWFHRLTRFTPLLQVLYGLRRVLYGLRRVLPSMAIGQWFIREIKKSLPLSLSAFNACGTASCGAGKSKNTASTFPSNSGIKPFWHTSLW